MYHFSNSSPINDKLEVLKLQNFLIQECEKILGPRDYSYKINQPVFKEKGPYIFPYTNDLFVEVMLSKNAENYWPTTLFELSHETVHILNPVMQANYLEEGFAALFSIEMSKKFGDSQNGYKNNEYEMALNLLEQIPDNDLWEVGRKIRENFGSFSKISADQLHHLFPSWEYLLCIQLLEPFKNSVKNKIVRLKVIEDISFPDTTFNLSKKDNEISYNLMYEDEIVGDIFGQVSKYGEFLTVIKFYRKELRSIGLGFKIFSSIFMQLNQKTEIKVITGSWHSDDEFKDYDDGKSTNLKIFQESQIDGDSKEISAYKTPTGKWAKKLGFTSCKIISISNESVVVNFFKGSETNIS